MISKMLLLVLAPMVSTAAIAAPTYTVITGGQAEAMFDQSSGVVLCNGNTCSWTSPDQVSTPKSEVTTCSAKVKWIGRAGTQVALEGTAICLVAQLD